MPTCGTLTVVAEDSGGSGGIDPSAVAVEGCSMSTQDANVGDSVEITVEFTNNNSEDVSIELAWFANGSPLSSARGISIAGGDGFITEDMLLQAGQTGRATSKVTVTREGDYDFSVEKTNVGPY
jgi:hypothetical protein